ncbi:MAG: MBL fold metallo-hydrolase [Candidatus Bilamarchaeaceae archaeon]
MRITFYGGAEEVGRSAIVIEEGKARAMLDCGIKLGERLEFPLISKEELKGIHEIVLTHAHLDHSGYIPHLFSEGMVPRVYATKPTRDLTGVLFADYYRVQRAKGKPLFSESAIRNSLQKVVMVEYGQETGRAFRFVLRSAGHIMGSSMVHIPEKKFLYTGDMCMRKTRILEPCERNLSAETLVIESTYGGRKDILPSFKEAGQALTRIINETLDKGGHVLIPCFAVGRAQEILLMLDDYMRSGVLRDSRIYIEGMIWKALRIYRHNAIYANDDIKRRILMSEDDPFKSPRFHRPRTKDRVDVLAQPSIIISTSGMLTGGPALFYLEKLAENPSSTIIFVGYQAPGTLGRRITEGERLIKIGGREIELKLRVEQVRISGHADYNELLQFIKGVKDLKRVFLIHGEKPEIAEALERKYEVIVPRLLETYGF